MARDDLLNRVQDIQVGMWRGRRSPHKPILLLMAIGRHLNGYERLEKFDEIEDELNRLIRRFGLPNSPGNAYLPFWHLRNDDGLWEIENSKDVSENSAGHARIADLRQPHIRGGLTQEALDLLDGNPDVTLSVVEHLLHDYFPPSLHDEILREVNLDEPLEQSDFAVVRSRPRKGGKQFREAVLQAYGNRCAVCEFDVQVEEEPIGVEAAHIRWHSESGPAQIRNGLALCLIHHKFFDKGLLAVSRDFTVLVGDGAEGEDVESSLNQYGGESLQVIPDLQEQRPAETYMAWHRRAVFKSPLAV